MFAKMLRLTALAFLAAGIAAATAWNTRFMVAEALAILALVACLGLVAAAIAWTWHERRIDDGLRPS